MKRPSLFIVGFVTITILSGLTLSVQGGAPEGRYIVLFRGHELPADLESSVASAGGRLVRSMPEVGVAIALSDTEDFARSVRRIAGVTSVGPAPAHSPPETHFEAVLEDRPTEEDLLYQWGLLWNLDRVHAPEAWEAGHAGSHRTVVAVIDFGIAWNHPDLAPNVMFAACFTSNGAWIGPWEAGAPCNPYPEYDDHGTHVAGTIAAAFGGGWAVGVAPKLGLASYNTFEPIDGCGICSYADTRWAAMLDAAARGFDVINMSLGVTAAYGSGKGTDGLATFVAVEQRIAKYVSNLGTTVVAAAGNLALNLSGTIVHLPGDVPAIINVGATGIQPIPIYPFPESYDVRAFYANYGAPLTVSAPGGDCGEISGCSGNPGTGFPFEDYLILSTIVFADPSCAQTASCEPWYGYSSGTSMAAPHVSAIAALVKDANGRLSPGQVKSILKKTAEQVGSRQEFGHGVVNAHEAAIAAAKRR
jgi:subtilisin family serine protease